jgi:hypothetical protein
LLAGRALGGIVGLVSIFLAWVTTTVTASVFVFGSESQTATAVGSSNLINILGNASSISGFTVGGVLFIFGCLLAIFTYYGWIVQGFGLVAFVMSIPAQSTTSFGIGTPPANAIVTSGAGIGIALAAVLVIIGLFSWVWANGWLKNV